MKIRTNVKASGSFYNHNETLVRDNGKNLKFKTALRAGYKKASYILPCVEHSCRRCL
jgi:hypothetical protein